VLFTATVLVFTGLRADSVLRRSEERFRALVQNGSDVIAVLDADGAVIFVSPSFTTVLGHDLTDSPPRNAREYVHPDDYDAVVSAFTELVGGAGAGTHSAEIRVRRADGTYAWMDVSLTDMRGSAAGGVVVNARDTDDSRRLREELRRQATVDALTGAGNRRMLYERLTQELDGSDARVTVLYIDVDRFKR
jgi:PAS domain S-box-containing protein